MYETLVLVRLGFESGVHQNNSSAGKHSLIYLQLGKWCQQS